MKKNYLINFLILFTCCTTTNKKYLVEDEVNERVFSVLKTIQAGNEVMESDYDNLFSLPSKNDSLYYSARTSLKESLSYLSSSSTKEYEVGLIEIAYYEDKYKEKYKRKLHGDNDGRVLILIDKNDPNNPGFFLIKDKKIASLISVKKGDITYLYPFAKTE